MLEAFRKEYQKLYLAHENLKKKKKMKSSKRICLDKETITRVERQTKLQPLRIERLKLSDIKKLVRNLLPAQRKPKKESYYDVYSDDGVESGGELSESDGKSQKAQTRRRTVAKTTTEPATGKEEKTTKRNYRLSKQLILIT